MWQSIRMPSGRWFVVRFSRGKNMLLREFHKHGHTSVAFETEKRASAEAKKLNLAVATHRDGVAAAPASGPA